jgi:phage anti-repressor protein
MNTDDNKQVTQYSILLAKVKKAFNKEQQEMFAKSFYYYLNMKKGDFAIDLEGVWVWLGFNNKANCKKILIKYFVENTHYIIKHGGQNKELALPIGRASSTTKHGGQNKETILMNVDTFKDLCLTSRTNKAKEVRDYFIKLEEINMEYMKETQISEVNERQIQQTFSQDQIHHSNDLISHFGDKTNIFYAFLFKYTDSLYVKFGITRETRGFYNRIQEHLSEFNEICFFNVLEVSDPNKIESDFKDTSLVSLNREKVPRKNGGNHNEIIKLSNTVTSHKIKSLMTSIAGDKILDPPPAYIRPIEYDNTLLIEKEKTKQIELETQEKTKQMQEKTKQMELELKILQFKMLQLSQEEPVRHTDETKKASKQVYNSNQNQNEKQAIFDQTKEQRKQYMTTMVQTFMNCCTEHSVSMSDQIYIYKLHERFELWFNDNKLNEKESCISLKVFNTYLTRIGYIERHRKPIEGCTKLKKDRKIALANIKFK